MTSIDGTLLDLKQLDQLAMGTTQLHRLDPRAKVLAAAAFIVAVVSFGRYELTPLLPFLSFPVALAALGNLPPRNIVRKVILVLPFALMVGLLNPLIDREVLVRLGPIGISGGWISCASIVLRAVLTLSTAVILVGVTGFPAICRALDRLGMPRAFTVQLQFLYRYLFVLTEEGGRATRARELRTFGRKGSGMRVFGSLICHLLLRTWQRAERIHMAMLARGFTGEFHARIPSRFGAREIIFLTGWTTFFIIFRWQNGARLLGSLATGLFR